MVGTVEDDNEVERCNMGYRKLELCGGGSGWHTKGKKIKKNFYHPKLIKFFIKYCFSLFNTADI